MQLESYTSDLSDGVGGYNLSKYFIFISWKTRKNSTKDFSFSIV